jgi:hypothetical protein
MFTKDPQICIDLGYLGGLWVRDHILTEIGININLIPYAEAFPQFSVKSDICAVYIDIKQTCYHTYKRLFPLFLQRFLTMSCIYSR